MAALFARLKEEVRAAGPRGADVTPAQVDYMADCVRGLGVAARAVA